MQKLSFSFLFILICTSSYLCAQESSFGFKAGVNIGSLGGDSQGTSSKVAAHFGFVNPIRASERIVIQPELIYSQQGATIDAAEKAKIKYNYLNLPIILKVFPFEKGIHLHAGPQVGLLMTGKVREGQIELDAREGLNKLDFAMGLGFGYDINSLIIDIRHNIGINSTSKETSLGTFPMQTFQISIGTVF